MYVDGGHAVSAHVHAVWVRGRVALVEKGSKLCMCARGFQQLVQSKHMCFSAARAALTFGLACVLVSYFRNHHNVWRKDARVHVDRVAVLLHVVLQHPSELRDARVRDRRREALVPARAARAQRLRRRLGHVPQLLRRQQLARARVLRTQLVDEQPGNWRC